MELETDRLADVLQAFLGGHSSQKCVPAPTHRHSKIELAVASVLHSSSMCLEGRGPAMRRPHDDDKIQCATVPPGEEVSGPVVLGIARRLAVLLLQRDNNDFSLGQK